MLEEVTLDTEKQLMRVKFGSCSTIESWKRALVHIERISEETGICRVLVDVRKQTTVANTTALFDFGAHLPCSIAFAVLCEINLDEHRFIETVATNRGIAVKDFDSEQSAVEWLETWPNKSMDSDRKNVGHH